MKSETPRPVKRSFSIRGHRTSISLEQPFWEALKDAAARERIPLAALIARIDEQRGAAGLSSAVRVWILDDVRSASVAVSYDGGNRD
ncbi:ribbon-helix-helix domain-containing protein [uncultured Hyphomicrobium sp.]|uniref:ribbon-helix-helix domain-containing protein n=1 Tax=uncultured Hyphomicrobium sp. TaxID=194373 RepID=UPI0025CF7ECA|nr:ribbon-helix-helix domain-containing protein [uncultured Hyphomicrobium sp.]